MRKQNKGITLIALVITIIILLILAGITINSLTSSGLLTKAGEATRISKLKEIEEFARLSYMERQLEEITEGKATTIARVINDLKEKAYKIKEITEGANSITGITLKEDNVIMEKSQQKEITYTFVYLDETTVRYFTEIDGKNYEIIFNNGKITVNTEETNIGKINKKPEVTVTSNDSSIIEANKTEDGKIILRAKEKIGDVEIEVKEINSNVTKTLTAIVKVMPEKLTLSSTEETIKRMGKIKLNATVEPNDVTDEIGWFSSDENIVKVSDDGTIIGMGVGNATIWAQCGEVKASCTIEVTNESTSFKELESVGYTLEDFFITTTETTSVCWMDPLNKKLSSLGFRLWTNGNNYHTGEMKIVWDLKNFRKEFGKFKALKGKAIYSDRGYGAEERIVYNCYGADYHLEGVPIKSTVVVNYKGQEGVNGYGIPREVGIDIDISNENVEFLVFEMSAGYTLQTYGTTSDSYIYLYLENMSVE